MAGRVFGGPSLRQQSDCGRAPIAEARAGSAPLHLPLLGVSGILSSARAGGRLLGFTPLRLPPSPPSLTRWRAPTPRRESFSSRRPGGQKGLVGPCGAVRIASFFGPLGARGRSCTVRGPRGARARACVNSLKTSRGRPPLASASVVLIARLRLSVLDIPGLSGPPMAL